MSITFLPSGLAEVTKKSPFTGKEHTLTLPMTFVQYGRWALDGERIQIALPHLTPDQREFLLTGLTGEEWEEFMFVEPDQE